MLLVAAFLCAAGCRHAPASRPGPATAQEVIVTPELYGSVPALDVGQTLVVVPADRGAWQVDFDETLLERLTPPERMRAPGSAGWRFRARAAGNGEIVLTSIVSDSGGQRPPMPARFVLLLKVKR